MTTARQHAEQQILRSDLTPGQQIAGFKLLALASETNGYLCLGWDDLLELFNLQNQNAARRHLSRLQAEEIIHYSSNSYVYVTFKAWITRRQERVGAPPQARGRAASGALDDEDVEEHAPLQARGRAASGASDDAENATRRQERVGAPPQARGRAASGALADTNWLVGLNQDPTPGDLVSQTNQPKPGVAGEKPPALTAEQQRSANLLRDPDVGLGDKSAQRLAREHRWDWILRQVMAWREEMDQGKVDGPGALVNRLDQNFAPGELTERDRASPLYRRHVSDEEERQREADRYTSGFDDVIKS